MFLFQLDDNSGFYGSVKLPLADNGKNLKFSFIALLLQIFLQKVYKIVSRVVLFHPC